MKTIFQLRERCWPGYKPTPGRKAYAKGSCVKEANAAAIAAATAIAKKKSGNYDKEGMRKTPYKNPDHPSVKSNEQRRKDMKENFAGDSPQQVAGSAQSTLTDRPNKEPMKKYKELKNITELSTDLLDRYKEKAADDSAKADKEGDIARGDKRFSGVVKATSKQFDNFRKKGFGEAITDKTDNFKVIKPKESEHETYFKFVTGKAKMGKALSNKEKDFVKSYKLMKQEEVEQIDEISAMAHAKYRDAARKDIKANLKHIHGEYGDIAKNIVNRRMKGLAMSNATTKLKKEEVEQIDENAMHGTVYLHKYHEGSSEDSYGEVGKNHTQHAYKVYHKKPGEKPTLIGDTENNVHNKTKKTAHAVARNDEMEYDHKSHNDAVRHVMDAAGVHSATPIRYIKDKKQMNEEVEQIDEKNVPTSPEKWAQAKSQAKAKFDVYPSAYANGWAAKKYKAMGGGWKSVSEAVKDKFDIGEYDQEGDMAKSDLRSIMANAKKLHDMIEDADNLPEWCQNKITLAEDYISTVANYLTAEMNEEVEQIDELVGKGKLPAIAAYHKQKSAEAKDKMEKVRNTNTKLPVPKATSTKIYAKDAEAKYHSIQAKRANTLMKKEAKEVEQIDELKKSTLASYATKASDDAKNKKDAATSYAAQMKGYSSKGMQKSVKADKRIEGVKGAIKRLAKEAKEDLPFTPDKPKKQSVVAGKYGAGYSTARHLARTAMQKQVEKMKKAPIKEESRKAAIVKDIMKKKKGSEDAFQKDPEMSSTLTKL